jgi:hypothetical protein
MIFLSKYYLEAFFIALKSLAKSSNNFSVLSQPRQGSVIDLP